MSLTGGRQCFPVLGVPPPPTLQFVIEVLRSLARSLARSPSLIAIALAAVAGAAAYPQLRRTGQKSLFGLSPARSLAPPPPPVAVRPVCLMRGGEPLSLSLALKAASLPPISLSRPPRSASAIPAGGDGLFCE